MRRDAFPALLLATLWLLTYVALSKYLVFTLPPGLRSQLTLSAYLWIVQVLTASVGIALVFVAMRKDQRLGRVLLPFGGTARTELASLSGDASARQRALGQAVVLAAGTAPLVYVFAHGAGMALAYRVLLSELAVRGVQGVQKQAGELGRSALSDSLWIVVPFMVLVAPLAEELLFRGAWFGAIRSLFGSRTSLPPHARTESAAGGEVLSDLDEEPSSSPLSIPGLARAKDWQLPPWVPSLLAWLLSSSLFGWMHADLSGGMGLMRTTSACVLGLACGWARWKTGSLLPCIALHALFNLASLATLRGWLVFAGWPTKYALPTLLLVVAPISALVALALAKWWWRR